MARKPNRSVIGRTLTLSHCLGIEVLGGQIEEYYRLLVGDYTPEKATRKLRKMECNESITIKTVEHETGYFTMDVYEFIQMANCKLKEKED